MPVALTKVKPKPQKTSPTPVVEQVEKDNPDLTLEELADRYGLLRAQCELLMSDPVFVRCQQAEEELKARLQNYEPDEIIKIEGKEYLIEAGACSKAPRKVTNIEKVMKLLPIKTFLKLASITVGDAEKYLTPEQVAQVVNEPGFTKNRKIVVAYKGVGKS